MIINENLLLDNDGFSNHGKSSFGISFFFLNYLFYMHTLKCTWIVIKNNAHIILSRIHMHFTKFQTDEILFF